MTTADTRPFLTPQELAQPLYKNAPITVTTSGDTAENVLTIATRMSYATKLSFKVDTFDLYVAFDEDATSSSMLIVAGTGYSEENIYIGTRISVINASAGSNGRIIGMAWGR